MVDEGFLSKIDDQIKDKIQKAGSWIFSVDGKTIIKITSALSSLAIAEPIGFLMPLIIDASDIVVRKRFLKHLPDLAIRISNINNLNHQFVESENGQKLLKDTMKQIIHETNEEKIEYLKRFLINTYESTNNENELISHYFSVLSSLTPTELKILKILHEPESFIDQIMKKNLDPKTNVTNIVLRRNVREFLGIGEPVFETMVMNLINNNLINVSGKNVEWSIFDFSVEYKKDILNQAVKETKRLFTPFGIDFINHILNDDDPK